MKIKIVAFYTPSYADEIKALHATASELGLKVCETRIKDLTWSRAVMYKPEFIWDQLMKLEEEFDGLLYTDADSRFRRVPDWDQFKGLDFSCHFFRRSPVCEPEMLTGTMYFGNGKNVLPFVASWALRTEQFASTDTPEQRSLTVTWENWKDVLSFKDFGPELVWIFDDFIPLYPGRMPVIEHMQASRQRRR